MTDDKSLAIRNGGQIASVEESKDAVYMIMMFHPVLRDIKRDKGEAAAKVAAMEYIQLSLATGASPIPSTNEMHILPDGRSHLGANYWERQSQQRGGVIWIEQPRVLTDDERRDHMVDDGDLAMICYAMKRDDFPQLKELIEVGFDRKEAIMMLAVSGVGIVRKGEMKYKSGADANKKGRTTGWWATKRAKASLLKQLFPFDPSLSRPGAGLKKQGDAVIIDGDSHEWREVEYTIEAEAIQENGFNGGQQNDDGGQVVGNSSLYQLAYETYPNFNTLGEVDLVGSILEKYKACDIGNFGEVAKMMADGVDASEAAEVVGKRVSKEKFDDNQLALFG